MRQHKFAALLVGLLLIASPVWAVIDIGCFSCDGPQFATQVLQELIDERESEPLDTQAAWLRSRLTNESADKLYALQAGIAGACVVECSATLTSARAVVDALLAQRVREEERAFQQQEQRTTVLASAVGAVAGGLATALFGLLISRRRKRSARGNSAA